MNKRLPCFQIFSTLNAGNLFWKGVSLEGQLLSTGGRLTNAKESGLNQHEGASAAIKKAK
jgi:hypothetical protein